MFDRPQLLEHADSCRSHASTDDITKLGEALRREKFVAQQLDGTFGFEDLYGNARYEVATIELPKATDRLQQRQFLRQWQR